MADDWLRYDKMVEEALRGVVRQALQETAQHGLPGNHHFYVTFHTNHSGVEMGQRLRAQYPDEMTIVLQHQFWGLEVAEDAFAVTLSFNNAHERLVVPFAAITGFADPSVKFGLQFEAMEADLDENAAETRAADNAPAGAPTGAPAEVDDKKGADVVTLDTFRKK